MEIKISEKFCILTPLNPKLDKYYTSKLQEEISRYSELRIGLDLTYVSDCTFDFFEMIKNLKTISLFNIHSDIFTLFNIMKIDKIANLYVSELDFKTDKHRLLNRAFCIV